MNKIAIVYWSGTGNTEAMAEHVAAGARDAGADVTVFTSAQFSAAEAEKYDAIGFGCPAMGAEVLEEDEFEPMFTELESKLAGKPIVLFGSYGWGDGEWMRNWEDTCRGIGAKLMSKSVICMDAPDEDAATQCRNLGIALAQ